MKTENQLKCCNFIQREVCNRNRTCCSYHENCLICVRRERGMQCLTIESMMTESCTWNDRTARGNLSKFPYIPVTVMTAEEPAAPTDLRISIAFFFPEMKV